jgi:hypothetical protein
MTRLFLPILALSLLLASCKKEKPAETTAEPEEQKNATPPVPVEPAPIEPKDEVVQYEFKPAKDISSVRSYTSYYTVCTNIYPFPNDSSASYDLDINADQVADFRFTASHNPSGPTSCKCHISDYRILVEPLAAGDSVAFLPTSGPKLFNKAEIIGPNTKTWRSLTAPLLVEMCFGPGYIFSEGYLGIKVDKSFGYIHIDRTPYNGVLILDYGINKTENRPIACGQK